MLMQTADETLARRAQSGDAEAFGQLLTRHYDLIFRLAFRMLGRRADAEDLAQDICAALPGKLAGFRAEARFSTWLYRVVSNAAIDRMRRRQSRIKAADGWGEAELLRRAESHEKQAEINWLQQAMSTLSPELRQTVALVLGEEMTHAQTAGALDISEGTVSWRMSEVKKRLRAQARTEEVLK
jgi:RNA polymerase sigma-70 factor, ECF subfamily